MSSSVFGKVHLGYVVIETQRFSDWRRFGRDAIGMHLDDGSTDVMRFRLDDNECRFLLQRGPAEDVTALGWQLDDHDTFDTVLARVAASWRTGHRGHRRGGRATRRGTAGPLPRTQRADPGGLHPRAARRDAVAHGGWRRIRHRRSGFGSRRRHHHEARIRCAATTTPCSTRGCPTTSTRRSAASSSRSASCGSTSVTTPWRSPRSTACG